MQKYDKTKWVANETLVAAEKLNKIEVQLEELTNKSIEFNSQCQAIKAKIEQENTPLIVPIANGSLALTTDKLQTTTMKNNTTIVLPVVDKFTEIHLFFSTTEALTIILPNIKWNNSVNIEANKTYEFIFTYINNSWLGGIVPYV